MTDPAGRSFRDPKGDCPMFDRFVLIACAMTVCALVAGWCYDSVEAAESERFGVTTVEHAGR